MVLKDNFGDAGFLSSETRRRRHNIRAENRDWFELADEVNYVLMKIISHGRSLDPGYNWSQRAVAIRLLMRTTTSFQGVIKLSELGMISPARTLVRTIVEDSFCAARLDKKPEDIIEKLRKESEAVRKKQANFILDNSLSDDQSSLDRLKEAVARMEKEKRIDWRKEAMDGELWRQFLTGCCKTHRAGRFFPLTYWWVEGIGAFLCLFWACSRHHAGCWLSSFGNLTRL